MVDSGHPGNSLAATCASACSPIYTEAVTGFYRQNPDLLEVPVLGALICLADGTECGLDTFARMHRDPSVLTDIARQRKQALERILEED